MLWAANVSASVLCVDVNCTNPTPPYTNWVTAATNIQDAVDAAMTSDQVWVTNGVYATGGRWLSGSTTNRVVVDKAVLVQSVNGPQFTVIQGNQAWPHPFRCVYLTNGASLSGFTLTNGGAYAQNGGGVCCGTTNEMVLNCVVTSNACNEAISGGGGGVYSGTLSNCALIANWCASSGGGAYKSTLIDCTLSNNWSAGNGGGAFNGILRNCTLTGNSAPGGCGGGAYRATLLNCLLIGNASGPTQSAGVDVAGGGAAYGTLNHAYPVYTQNPRLGWSSCAAEHRL
jgi:hypothetical protein